MPPPKDTSPDTSASGALGRFGSDISIKSWSRERRCIAEFLGHQVFEVVLAALVFTSLAMVIIDTDINASGSESPWWIEPVEDILLAMYCIEMCTRVYILRLSLFHSPLNVTDLTIVVLDVVFFVARFSAGDLPNISFLRVLRLVKLSRVFHVLAMQPQLYIMLEALWSTFQSTMFGCLFIAVALVIYSIIAVEFIRPLPVEFSSTCGRCPYAFDSVYLSIMTFIQTVIIGDDWGDFFLPYAEAYPATLIFIIPVFVTVNFGLMNLIMAVIVDCASQARLHNVKEMAEDKEFVQQLYKMKSNNSQTMLVFIKHYVTELQRTLAEEMTMIKENVLGGISTLQEQLSEELTLLKEDIALNRRTSIDFNGSSDEVRPQNEQVTRMPKEAFFTPEVSAEVQDVLAPVMHSSASSALAASDGQLRSFSEKIAASIEDLRRQCENSALLLTSFHSLLPVTNGAEIFSANSCPNMSSDNVEQPKSACSEAPLAQTQEARTECVEASKSRSAEITAEVDFPLCKINPIANASCLNDAVDVNAPAGGSESANTANNEITLAVIDCHIHSATCQRESHTISHECPPQITDHETAGCVEDPVLSATIDNAPSNAPLLDSQSRPLGALRQPMPLLSYSNAVSIIDQPTSHLLCPHSSPFDSSLEFAFEDDEPHLGFEIHWVKNELPLVGGVMPDGAASKRGVLPGDRLAGCNGLSIMGKSREEVLQLLRVRPLTLTISRSRG